MKEMRGDETMLAFEDFPKNSSKRSPVSAADPRFVPPALTTADDLFRSDPIHSAHNIHLI